jgi:hypothetical protein
MNSISRYIADAKAQTMESFSNADGFIDDDFNFTGDDFFRNASGASMQQNVQTSQPYIVTVTSTAVVAVPNFEILGAYQYLNDAGFTPAGDLVIGLITISSGIPSVTYREFLYQSMNSPFSIGLTYVQSQTSNQILETISINTRDANGNTAQKTIVPTIDPYQNQSDVVAIKYNYRIDGFTKLIIRQVLANAVIRVNFYPADNINIARALGGDAVSRQFGAPRVTGGQTIQIKA